MRDLHLGSYTSLICSAVLIQGCSQIAIGYLYKSFASCRSSCIRSALLRNSLSPVIFLASHLVLTTQNSEGHNNIYSNGFLPRLGEMA
jgi:hypothetical protein